jgi:hypothetical protein
MKYLLRLAINSCEITDEMLLQAFVDKERNLSDKQADDITSIRREISSIVKRLNAIRDTI